MHALILEITSDDDSKYRIFLRAESVPHFRRSAQDDQITVKAFDREFSLKELELAHNDVRESGDPEGVVFINQASNNFGELKMPLYVMAKVLLKAAMILFTEKGEATHGRIEMPRGPR